MLAAEASLAGDVYEPSGNVLVDELGRPLTAAQYYKRFQRADTRAGVPKIKLHDCRHTAATLMRQAGVHPEVIAHRLGQSRGSFTMPVYVDDPTEAAMVDAGSRLGKLLSSGPIWDKDSGLPGDRNRRSPGITPGQKKTTSSRPEREEVVPPTIRTVTGSSP